MQPMPKVPERESFYFPKRWIIWDPIPDWLELNRETIDRLFVIGLQAEKEHLAVEQKKIDMVTELFAKR